jgi:hypothetical protein
LTNSKKEKNYLLAPRFFVKICLEEAPAELGPLFHPSSQTVYTEWFRGGLTHRFLNEEIVENQYN